MVLLYLGPVYHSCCQSMTFIIAGDLPSWSTGCCKIQVKRGAGAFIAVCPELEIQATSDQKPKLLN